MARPFLNLIRQRGLKSLFLAVEDLRLYNYHSHEYDGIALKIFETIQFMEEQQWCLVGLESAYDTIESGIE